MQVPLGYVQVAVAYSQDEADLMQAVLEASAVKVFVVPAASGAAGFGLGSSAFSLCVADGQAERARQVLAGGEGTAD